ncbi:MAG: aspartate aminotransferase family protein [Cyclobacteriaceae bacterium]|nr:aspartate aminotransferase family protein [Cyclobacteriaceae bacterium]
MSHQTKTQIRLAAELNETLFNQAHAYGMEYLNEVTTRTVFPSTQAIHNLTIFDEPLPKDSAPATEILELLNEHGAPATVAQMGGRYFGFVSGGSVPAGLAAKSLATFWDQSSAMYVQSPLVSVLETVVESWLQEAFGLPHETVAGFVTGSSAANFCGLAAARFRILTTLGWNVNQNGLRNAPQVRIVTGRHAHSTVVKALMLLGFGKNDIEWVDVDAQGRLIVEKLPPLGADTILILQAGNVNSGAFDPFTEINQVVKDSGAWIHIDGAFGLWANASNELNHHTKGIEFANSWAVDGHKTLNTPYDCGIVLCNDRDALTSALHMVGDYIVYSEQRDGMLYTPDMSRRSRIIELWATIKSLGKTGMSEMILNMHRRAVQFAKEINKVEGFAVLNEVVFNQVMVMCNTDEITNTVLSKIQQDGVCWAGGSVWFGRKVIRISVCSWVTNEADITLSVNSFKKALE